MIFRRGYMEKRITQKNLNHNGAQVLHYDVIPLRWLFISKSCATYTRAILFLGSLRLGYRTLWNYIIRVTFPNDCFLAHKSLNNLKKSQQQQSGVDLKCVIELGKKSGHILDYRKAEVRRRGMRLNLLRVVVALVGNASFRKTQVCTRVCRRLVFFLSSSLPDSIEGEAQRTEHNS